ncbi:hypothetical protein TNCV_4161331 [Trichonephila clavipes]|nr:hypothetical protein TNCV_4161331 [Trichonephila clavipes]
MGREEDDCVMNRKTCWRLIGKDGFYALLRCSVVEVAGKARSLLWKVVLENDIDMLFIWNLNRSFKCDGVQANLKVNRTERVRRSELGRRRVLKRVEAL